ncbi:hypothetical protein A9Q83_05780 [Alphaproteobacteria bacterium 46_93_T64]|nr:hypothetical protein A9Q83_05780 [Alphaproteobacteria bacterium 46_93_T64]
MEFEINAVLIGTGATVIMDLWALFQKRVFGVPALNYAMVGRWIGHLPRGHFIHDNIGKAVPIHGEKMLGWGAHYVIGIIFAAGLLVFWGPEWAFSPTLMPAITVGLLTVMAPFFILQPAMGAGVAASRTPNPNISRLRSLIAHFSFGLGLYISAMIWS